MGQRKVLVFKALSWSFRELEMQLSLFQTHLDEHFLIAQFERHVHHPSHERIVFFPKMPFMQ